MLLLLPSGGTNRRGPRRENARSELQVVPERHDGGEGVSWEGILWSGLCGKEKTSPASRASGEMARSRPM